MPVRHFDPQHNPLENLVEDDTALATYVDRHRLIPRAALLWGVSPPEVRGAVLFHLYQQVQADSLCKRFGAIREGLNREQTVEGEFLNMCEKDDLLGEIPLPLHVYIALYFEAMAPEASAGFGDEAFFDNYRGAHTLFAKAKGSLKF